MKCKKKLMMNCGSTSFLKIILFLHLLVLIAACKQNNQTFTNATIIKDSFVSPQITILADLPDSNQPKQILLEKSAAPITIKVPDNNSNYIEQRAIRNKLIALTPPRTHSFIDKITNLPLAVDAQGKGFFTTYSTDNGLALDQINCSYKDDMGNLWFGTNAGGVSKYDGKTFTNYTTAHGLASNIIWSIAEDKQGNLWFGTDGNGVSKYDGKTFTNYTTKQGFSNNVVFSVVQDRSGNLWFGTLDGGVNKYDGKTFTHYTTAQGLANNDVKVIKEDRSGNLWFGTLGGGVSKYDGKFFTNYTTSQGLANNFIRDILQDQSGNLWFGTDGGGVSKYDGKIFTNYSAAQGLSNNKVWSICEDKMGNLWFGTNGGGVSKYDGNFFTNYTTTQGLADNFIRNILQDQSGNLWFGTYGDGVSKYGGKAFINFTTAQGLSNNTIWSICEDKMGNLWFGTSSGVNQYNGKSINNFTKPQSLADNVIYSIAKDKKGNLWFGTSGHGVSKYDGKYFTTYTTKQGLANNIVFNIFEDRKSNIWFSTSGGVSKYDGKSFTNYTIKQGLTNNAVRCMLEDVMGNLWFGTNGGGVSKYDGKSFTNYTTAQGLSNNVVWTITEDKVGNLWFGTNEGLSLLRSESLQQISANNTTKNIFSGHLFESVTTKDGLPDNVITQIIQSDDQKLYIGTNLGICELITDSLRNKWTVGKIFNSINGYPIKDVNAGQGAMFKDSKGIIWIGTGSDKTGLVRFDPKAITNNNLSAPNIVIQNIKINNQNICWNDLDQNNATEKRDSNTIAPNITEEVSSFGRQLTEMEKDSMRTKFGKIKFESIRKWYPVPEKLILPHDLNDISFDFTAIETGANTQIKYQYILEGYDKDWSPPDYKTSVNFGNIFEGTYTFKVRAKTNEGSWTNPITYTFKVLPPWWRTWWMFVIYAILTIACIIIIFWWNNWRIISQKRILEHKVEVATKQIREEKENAESQKKKAEETLSELKSTQQQLIQSEKMASLGELTAGIAHEIQNPLNFVNNFSEVSNELIDEMKAELDKGDIEEAKNIAADVKQNLEKINHHGKRADAIVKGMLQHSRSSSGIKEPTDINVLADEYLRLAYHGLRAKDKSFNATMKTDFDEGIGKINITPQDIGRVILNLITNAFYVVDEKKKFVIENYEPTVYVSTKKNGDEILISVKDNGNGIPPKVLDKIFQPFFTTKPTGKGTGLGLSLSYDIIKAHKGELKVETKEGEGTTFIIVLPLK